ncbi:hypothetical protein C8F01DRAFT_1230286 [Mycena amicta]|nr:hypothetical protein C8F01DRAFT_1230286 [Mycena amicta]
MDVKLTDNTAGHSSTSISPPRNRKLDRVEIRFARAQIRQSIPASQMETHMPQEVLMPDPQSAAFDGDRLGVLSGDEKLLTSLDPPPHETAAQPMNVQESALFLFGHLYLGHRPQPQDEGKVGSPWPIRPRVSALAQVKVDVLFDFLIGPLRASWLCPAASGGQKYRPKRKGLASDGKTVGFVALMLAPDGESTVRASKSVGGELQRSTGGRRVSIQSTRSRGTQTNNKNIAPWHLRNRMRSGIGGYLSRNRQPESQQDGRVIGRVATEYIKAALAILVSLHKRKKRHGALETLASNFSRIMGNGSLRNEDKREVAAELDIGLRKARGAIEVKVNHSPLTAEQTGEGQRQVRARSLSTLPPAEDPTGWASRHHGHRAAQNCLYELNEGLGTQRIEDSAFGKEFEREGLFDRRVEHERYEAVVGARGWQDVAGAQVTSSHVTALSLAFVTDVTIRLLLALNRHQPHKPGPSADFFIQNPQVRVIFWPALILVEFSLYPAIRGNVRQDVLYVSALRPCGGRISKCSGAHASMAMVIDTGEVRIFAPLVRDGNGHRPDEDGK